MKPAKFIVLVGAVLGLVGFFLPLLKATAEGKEISVSSFQVMTGVQVAQGAVDQVKDEVRSDVAKAGETGAAERAQVKKGLDEVDEMLSRIKIFVLVLFAPTVLLLLIGGIATVRKKFGRGGGILAFLVGGLGTGMWALVNAAIGEVSKEPGGGGVAAGIGLWMLLVVGLAGVIGGILVLVKPDDGLRGAGKFGR